MNQPSERAKDRQRAPLESLAPDRYDEHVAIGCFEHAVSLLGRGRPGAAERALALLLCGLVHLEHQPDADRRFAVALHWLAAKACFLLGNERGCAEMAQACLQLSRGLPTIFAGYAYEALCRAEMLADRPARASSARRLAEECAQTCADLHAAQGLLDELAAD